MTFTARRKRTDLSRGLIWDLPTRLFHWLLVAAVATALLTGFVAHS